jgi:hypothetical protein
MRRKQHQGVTARAPGAGSAAELDPSVAGLDGDELAILAELDDEIDRLVTELEQIGRRVQAMRDNEEDRSGSPRKLDRRLRDAWLQTQRLRDALSPADSAAWSGRLDRVIALNGEINGLREELLRTSEDRGRKPIPRPAAEAATKRGPPATAPEQRPAIEPPKEPAPEAPKPTIEPPKKPATETPKPAADKPKRPPDREPTPKKRRPRRTPRRRPRPAARRPSAAPPPRSKAPPARSIEPATRSAPPPSPPVPAAPAPAARREAPTPARRRIPTARIALAGGVIAVAAVIGLVAGRASAPEQTASVQQPVAAPADREYRRAAARELRVLQSRRPAALKALRRASTPHAQAVAGRRLAAMHERAVNSLRQTPAPEGTRGTLDEALSGVARGYRRLAGAARRGDRGPYRAAIAQINHAETEFTQTLKAQGARA